MKIRSYRMNMRIDKWTKKAPLVPIEETCNTNYGLRVRGGDLVDSYFINKGWRMKQSRRFKVYVAV